MTLRTEKITVSLTLAALLHPTFQWVATVASTRGVPPPWWLATPLDRALPVVPAAVWVYVSWYPVAAVGLFAGRTTLRRMYCAYTLAFVACLMTYLVFPVTIERPALENAAGLSATILRALYAADLPGNLFPSFHAAVAAILWRLRPPSRLISAAASAWAVALCAACVLTRQHYVLDVVAGLVVGAVAVMMVEAAQRRLVETPPITTPITAYRATSVPPSAMP